MLRNGLSRVCASFFALIIFAILAPTFALASLQPSEQFNFICKRPESNWCVKWNLTKYFLNQLNDPHDFKISKEIHRFCGISQLTPISPHMKFIKVNLLNPERASYIFCQTSTIKNGGDYNLFAVLKAMAITRVRRQTSFTPRGRYRGQTQSQYLAIDHGNGKNEGKAEAHSAADSSRASVSGNSGMGQAQSQSIYDQSCDGCNGKSKDEAQFLQRTPEHGISNPQGYFPGYNKENSGIPLNNRYQPESKNENLTPTQHSYDNSNPNSDGVNRNYPPNIHGNQGNGGNPENDRGYFNPLIQGTGLPGGKDGRQHNQDNANDRLRPNGGMNPDQGYSSNMNPNQGYGSKVNPDQGYGSKIGPDQYYGSKVNPDQGYLSKANPDQGYGSKVNPDQGYFSKANPGQGYGSKVNPDQGYGSKANPDQGYGSKVNPNQGYGSNVNPNQGYGANVGAPNGYGSTPTNGNRPSGNNNEYPNISFNPNYNNGVGTPDLSNNGNSQTGYPHQGGPNQSGNISPILDKTISQGSVPHQGYGNYQGGIDNKGQAPYFNQKFGLPNGSTGYGNWPFLTGNFPDGSYYCCVVSPNKPQITGPSVTNKNGISDTSLPTDNVYNYRVPYTDSNYFQGTGSGPGYPGTTNTLLGEKYNVPNNLLSPGTPIRGTGTYPYSNQYPTSTGLGNGSPGQWNTQSGAPGASTNLYQYGVGSNVPYFSNGISPGGPGTSALQHEGTEGRFPVGTGVQGVGHVPGGQVGIQSEIKGPGGQYGGTGYQSGPLPEGQVRVPGIQNGLQGPREQIGQPGTQNAYLTPGQNPPGQLDQSGVIGGANIGVPYSQGRIQGPGMQMGGPGNLGRNQGPSGAHNIQGTLGQAGVPGFQGGYQGPGFQRPGSTSTQNGLQVPGGQLSGHGNQGAIQAPGVQIPAGHTGGPGIENGLQSPGFNMGGTGVPSGFYGSGGTGGPVHEGGIQGTGVQGVPGSQGTEWKTEGSNSQGRPEPQAGVQSPGGQITGPTWQGEGQNGRPDMPKTTPNLGNIGGPLGQDAIQGPGGQVAGPGIQGGTQIPGAQSRGPVIPGAYQGPGAQIPDTQKGIQDLQGGIWPANQYGSPGFQGGQSNVGSYPGTGPSGTQGPGVWGQRAPGDQINYGQQGQAGVNGALPNQNGLIQPGLSPNTGSNYPTQVGYGTHPVNGGNGAPLNVMDPNSETNVIDEDDSEAQASVSQADNGTIASASSKGGNDKGRAQTNVQGTYTGSGSFSAQAQISDENKAAESEVSGGKQGASSKAQGSGKKNKSQASVQLGSETGSIQTQSQSDGKMHSSNSQVQGSVKGGMADSQARGPGITSSQAQIGFTPYKTGDKSHDEFKTPFLGSGTAAAQSSGRTGQSQSQLHGTFKYGITYNGAAQAGASIDKDAVFPNRVNFEKINVFDENEKNINVDLALPAETAAPSKSHSIENSPQEKLNTPKDSDSEYNSHSHYDHHKTEAKPPSSDTFTPESSKRSFQTTYGPNTSDYEDKTDKEDNSDDYDPETGLGAEFEHEYPNFYEEESTHQALQSSDMKGFEVKQNTGGNSQHIVLSSLKDQDAFITQRSSLRPDERKIYQPGEKVPGTGGYTIPIGFTGSIKSVASRDNTYVIGSKDSPSQAQTVSLKPGTGNVKYVYPPARAKSVPSKDLKSLQGGKNDDDRYVSVSKSVTRDLDSKNNIQKQYSHTYYTKSSSCGYFTFTCTMVSGVDGRKKVCKPKIPTNPDGTPMRC